MATHAVDNDSLRRSILHELKKIRSNFGHLAFGELASKVFGFFTTIYLARVLGVEQFGMYSWVMAAFAYVFLFANFGFETYGTMRLAKVRSAEIINAVTLLRVVYALALSAIITTFTALVHSPRNSLLQLQTASVLLLPFSFQFAFRALDQMQWVGWQRFIQSSLFLLLVFLIVGHGAILWVPLLWFASTAISLIPLIAVLRKKLDYTFFVPPSSVIREVLRGSFSVGISSALVLFCLNLDTILLGVFRDSSSVGIYSAAYKIYYMGYVVAGLYYMAFLPTMSKASSRSPSLIFLFTRSLVVIGVVVTIVGYAVAGEMIRILFGGDFVQAIASLRILFVALGAACINIAFMNPLQAVGRLKMFNLILLIRALLFTASCILMIPIFGIEGAAISTLVGEVLTIGISYYQFSKEFNTGILV